MKAGRKYGVETSMFGGWEWEHWHIEGVGASELKVIQMEPSQYGSRRTRTLN